MFKPLHRCSSSGRVVRAAEYWESHEVNNMGSKPVYLMSWSCTRNKKWDVTGSAFVMGS